jgi:broad specificity phosphatase PhoE
MISRFANRPNSVALGFWGKHARSQGTVAVSRRPNADEHTIAGRTAPPLRRQKTPYFGSTVQLRSPIADLSSMALKRDEGDYYFEAHSEALSAALNSYLDLQQQNALETTTARERAVATAHDMDLVEASFAARDQESYDKILILLRHGEAQHNAFEGEYARTHGKSMEDANFDDDYPVDPELTGKGCGQMLDVSRRTAAFFNTDTGLQPHLFVVSPLRRAIQSALISFPTYTAQTSISNTPWICLPHCMEQANGNKSEFVSSPKELEHMFPGIDFTLLKESLRGSDVEELNAMPKVPLFESKMDLMERTDEFLRWIEKRDERVIVVSSHATWLQSLCAFSLQYDDANSKGLEMFKKGEMRSVGIKFY